MRWIGLGLLVLLLLPAIGGAEDGSTPDDGDLTIKGVVRSKGGEPVPWARVYWGPRERRREHFWVTGPDGTFQLDRLPPGRLAIHVDLYGVPRSQGLPKPRKVKAGTHDAIIELDLGEQLQVQDANIRFGAGVQRTDGTFVVDLSRGRKGPDVRHNARLYVETEDGVKSWWPTVRNGALWFRRLETGRPWVLYIPYSDGHGWTIYKTGKHLKAGAMTVSMQRGRKITGFVTGTRDTLMATYSGPPYSGLVARRGPVEVRIYPSLGWPFTYGLFEFPPLAPGRWNVSVFNVEEQRGRVAATVDAEAGEEIILHPKPSKEAYVAARTTR